MYRQLDANKAELFNDFSTAELNPGNCKTDSQVYAMQQTGVSVAAHHEASHCVTFISAWRKVGWWPKSKPRLAVNFVEITKSASGEWCGRCNGPNIFSTDWPQSRISEPYRPLMEAQIAIHLAGAVGESLHRGVVRWSEVQAFAATDLRRASSVGNDLFRLTGVPYDEPFFFARTRALLLSHWPAVEAVAKALIENHRIEGDQVMRIFGHVMS